MEKFIYVSKLACLCIGVIHLLSCNSEQKDKNVSRKFSEINTEDAALQFIREPQAILKDYDTWNMYAHNNINLSQDFIGLNKDSNAVRKDAFLNLLLTGNYVPIKIYRKENIPYYKLYTLNSNNTDIQTSIKQIAESELVNYNMEGKELPSFNYKDLQGNSYTKENTKGKIVVVKCWFIRCVACVKEFPDLNKLVEENKDRKDILFISLAMDSKQALSSFLKTKPFNYSVIPVQEEYMVNELNVRSFPTHIVLGKDGKITHVASNFHDLIYALNKEVAKG